MPASFDPTAHVPGLGELIARAGEKTREQELEGYWAAIDAQTIREETWRAIDERADDSKGGVFE
ncbi:MAG: hypothetical protein IH881_19575 [Myxococcales bacterium]|nr:hypothetical protein [Myxococcales bacterium]